MAYRSFYQDGYCKALRGFALYSGLYQLIVKSHTHALHQELSKHDMKSMEAAYDLFRYRKWELSFAFVGCDTWVYSSIPITTRKHPASFCNENKLSRKESSSIPLSSCAMNTSSVSCTGGMRGTI